MEEIIISSKHNKLLDSQHLFIFTKKVQRNIMQIEERLGHHSQVTPSMMTRILNKSCSDQTEILTLLKTKANTTNNMVVIIKKLLEYASLQPLFRAQYSSIFRKWYDESSANKKKKIIHIVTHILTLEHILSDLEDTNEYLTFCLRNKQKNKKLGTYNFVCQLYKDGIVHFKTNLLTIIHSILQKPEDEKSVELLIEIIPIIHGTTIFSLVENELKMFQKKMRQYGHSTRSRLLLLNAIESC